MQQIPIYFKSDFKLFIQTEAGFAVPFKFEFYTNMPSRPYIVKYDGYKYHNCELLEDGRLCIAFDDHGFGLGKLMIRQSYYLNDADYASEICDRVIAPQPVVNIDDNLMRSEIVLALSGDDTIEFTSQLPPYYQAGLTPEEHQALIDATVHAEEAAASANEQAGIATEAAKAADEARQALTTAYNEKVAALDADYAQKKSALEADYSGVKNALSSDYASVKAQLDADYAATKEALATDYATALAGLNDRMTTIESQFSADREAWNQAVSAFITASQATFDGKLTDWQSQVDAAIADITRLQEKDVEQDQKLSELEEELYEITKNIGVRINSGGSITFDTISIEKEGDAIEFTVYRETPVMPTVNAFCFSAYNNAIAIGASTALLCIKNTDGNWLSGFDGSINKYNFTDNPKQAHYKIVWEGSNISLYRDSIFISSAPASAIKIDRIGNLTRGVYWTGEISDFFYTTNNFKTSLFDLSGFSINDNVEIITETSGGKIKEYDEKLKNHGERLTILEEEISHIANVTEEEEVSVEDIYDGLSPKLIFEPNKNIASGGFFDSDTYDSFYFILQNDGKLYVPNRGSATWMRIAIFSGSLTSHTDYIFKDSTSTDFPQTADKALAGKKGQYVVVSLNTGIKNFKLAYNYAKIEKTLDESIHIPAIINNKVFGKSPIIIKVANSASFDVSVLNTNTGKYLIYTFKRHNYNVTIDGQSYIGGDVWNNNEVLNETGNTIAQGNLNFIYTIDGSVSGFEKEGNLHIGPGHGCEVADYTIFLADGKPFTPSNPEVIECSTFRAIWKSKCYAVDNTFATGNSNNYPKIVNGNKVLAAEHYLNAEFKADNIIDWSNKLVVKRNGTVFNALYGGMVQGYSPYFSDVIVNDATASWESWTSDGTISHKYGSGIYDKKIKGDEVTMWGNGYVIKQKMIQEQVNLNGHSYLYPCRYLTPTRTKVYMIPAKVSLLGSVGSADIFNDGDEINIRLVRKIEIVE